MLYKSVHVHNTLLAAERKRSPRAATAAFPLETRIGGGPSAALPCPSRTLPAPCDATSLRLSAAKPARASTSVRSLMVFNRPVDVVALAAAVTARVCFPFAGGAGIWMVRAGRGMGGTDDGSAREGASSENIVLLRRLSALRWGVLSSSKALQLSSSS